MTVALDFIVGLREAFTLRHAEERAVADGDARRSETRRLASAARARRAAARRLASPIAAVTLLREALEIALSRRVSPRRRRRMALDRLARDAP